ncbi:MAG: AI-2E family transporter [Bryobacteraceae bacterium]
MPILSPYLPAQKAIQFGITSLGLAALVALLYYGRGFFITLIISAMFAFILDPIVELAMRLRLPRPAAAGVVIGLAILALYALSGVVWRQFSHLTQDLPAYSARMNELFDKTSDELEDIEKSTVDKVLPKKLREQDEQIQQKPAAAAQNRRRKAGLPVEPPPVVVQEVKIHSEPRPAITIMYGYMSRYFHAILMLSFIPFLVYFMLSWSDHVRKSVLQLFRGEERYMVGKSLANVGELTRAYVLGNFILGLFLSGASAVGFFFLGVPYWAIVGPLSGFLSLAPYVGLPLAVLPPLMAALAIPTKFTTILILISFVTALHLTGLNFLYPKVVGRRVHLNPLVVTIALMFWSALWGGIGLLLAIPITAAIKAVFDNVESMRPYGKLLGE